MNRDEAHAALATLLDDSARTAREAAIDRKARSTAEKELAHAREELTRTHQTAASYYAQLMLERRHAQALNVEADRLRDVIRGLKAALRNELAGEAAAEIPAEASPEASPTAA